MVVVGMDESGVEEDGSGREMGTGVKEEEG